MHCYTILLIIITTTVIIVNYIIKFRIEMYINLNINYYRLMNKIEVDNSKMSESVLTETITKTEKNVAGSPSKAKNNSLRHRKIPSADLNAVS